MIRNSKCELAIHILYWMCMHVCMYVGLCMYTYVFVFVYPFGSKLPIGSIILFFGGETSKIC